MKKKLTIILSIVAVVVIAAVLSIPGVIGGSEHGSMSVMRMYADELDGEWSWEASETSRWVQEKSTYNGQTVITIRPIGDFLWEAPEGTLVFIQGVPVKEVETIKEYVPVFNNGAYPIDWNGLQTTAN